MKYFTQDEWNIATRFLFLSMTLTVIKQDLINMQQASPFKISEPYITLLQRMEQLASAEKAELQHMMKQKQLHVRVLPHTPEDAFTPYLFTCQGKEVKRNFYNPAIRRKVMLMLEELLEQRLEQSHSDPAQMMSML
ncbi:hypothetical protein [Gracilibacillus alcaliphilus]|uniref:hypothetical protein n=1 Tax=Gracilibacillus alcaliphilus TaxID=1401441 RepID=UPI00195AAB98|nr:hypothetical protein [Gracilibacillus alcaliphilus]MBM7675423.1 hypothetical protein [Gracilibacillus alcaliphilus]